MYVLYIQGIPKNKLLDIIKMETLEDIKFKKAKIFKMSSADSETLGTLFLQEGSWDRKLFVDKEGNLITKSSGGAGPFELSFLDMSGGEGIIVVILAIIAVFFVSFFIALIGAWIVGNMFTLGAYRWRKNKYILYVIPPKTTDDITRNRKIVQVIQRIAEKILNEGGLVKFDNPEEVPEDILLRSQKLKLGYTLFNGGRYTITTAIMFALFFETMKYIIDYFSNSYITISSEVAWIVWRYPLIIISLAGLLLLMIGEIKIRRAHSSFDILL